MGYSIHYKNSIWTNHALERLNDRNIPQDLAWKTFKFPDSTAPGKRRGTTEFYKKIDIYSFTVIASQNNKREWVILSCWVEPPFKGSIDIAKKKAYLDYKHSRGFKKLWLEIKRAFGFY